MILDGCTSDFPFAIAKAFFLAPIQRQIIMTGSIDGDKTSMSGPDLRTEV